MLGILKKNQAILCKLPLAFGRHGTFSILSKNISGDIGVEVVANNKVTNGILNGFKFRTAEESILDTVESLIELKLAA